VSGEAGARRGRRPWPWLEALGWTALAGGAVAAQALGGWGVSGGAGLGALVAHAVLVPLGVALLAGRVLGPLRWASAGCMALALALGALEWLPGSSAGTRTFLVYAHVALGYGALALLIYGRLHGRVTRPNARLVLAALAAGSVFLAPAGAYLAADRRPILPPEYDAEACYRFLTATTARQSGEPAFPSALRPPRRPQAETCTSAGCHADLAALHPQYHAASGANPAYGATLADFTRRKGTEASRWCRGCHSPGQVLDATGAAGVTCGACHAVSAVHALYGSAALVQAAASTAVPMEARARPRHHAGRMLGAGLQRSAEFCAACHRKNWSLPQNEYRWMPGPDEYAEWQGSRFGEGALYAVGQTGPRACVSCHDPHGGRTPPEAPTDPPLTLGLFLAAAGPGREPVEAVESLPAGTRARLDVVVRNAGIGHTFPTGMPDLWETWLEVRVYDRAGKLAAGSGAWSQAGPTDPDAHRYQLDALDRDGRPIRHGSLDEMVAVAEWRRIAPGEADLARYGLVVPEGGISRLAVRLLRRRRPEFARWAGEPRRPVQVLAERSMEANARVPVTPPRWREYGMALGRVKAYTEATRALLRALSVRGDDAETRLALGRVYLDEGDLLAAREQFAAAGHGPEAERAAAWEAAVLRQMGQPAQAAAMLERQRPGHPRDRQLHYELGRAYMDQLRNEEAAREFQALLTVDPTDVSGHYNLMLCWQRLNRAPEARREEDLYRLLAGDDTARGGEARRPAAREETPLHEHLLRGG
jgi:tetratricopeptide (TPR) repeat protein